MIYQRTDFDKRFRRDYKFPTYQSTKGARKNLENNYNIKEKLLEITLEFFSQFQPQERILKNTTMSTISLILVRPLQL